MLVRLLVLCLLVTGCTAVARIPTNYDRAITVRGGTAYVTYTDNMPDSWRGYHTKGRIYIRPSLINDKGVLAHELEHASQWYTTPLMSNFNKELGAYRKEIQTYPVEEQRSHAEWVADRMRGPIYKFNVDRDELISLLLKK